MKIFTKAILVLALILISNVVFSQWEKISTVYSNSFTASGSNLYIGSSGKIYRSSNNGTNFIQVGSIPNSNGEVYLGANGNRVFAGTNSGGVGGFFYTTDGDTNWTQTFSSPVYNIVTTPSNGMYVISNYYIWRSANNGLSFIQTGSPQYPSVLCPNNLGNIIYAGYGASILDLAGCVRFTTNNGSSWEKIQTLTLDSLTISDLKVDGTNIYLTTRTSVQKQGSIWISTNSGVNWSRKQFFYNSRYGYNTACVVNGDLFVGSDSGLYLSRDRGNTWRNKNEGFQANNNPICVRNLFFANGYLYATTGGNGYPQGLYRRLYTEAINVNKISTEVPANFSLSQNYPNPFNPTTNIRYQIPKESVVTIKIFDITGKEIETLVNEKVSPGTYETNWNASRYSSGMYFYKLESEYFSEVKKMIVAK